VGNFPTSFLTPLRFSVRLVDMLQLIDQHNESEEPKTECGYLLEQVAEIWSMSCLILLPDSLSPSRVAG
jgi:hypothetical protein